MKNIIAFIFIAMLIVIVTLSMGGCSGYNCTLESTPTGMIGHSNRRNVEASKTTDKDGNITMTYSSKKGQGILGDIITILSLGLIKK